MITRRRFIKFLGSLGLITFIPIQRLLKINSKNFIPQQQSVDGEFYANFLLLPENAEIPPFVEFPKEPMPRLCGVGADELHPKPDAVVHFFENIDDVSKLMNFTVYTFKSMPDGLRPGKAFSISLENGLLHSISLSYEAYHAAQKLWESVVSLWIFSIFPKPFPLWEEGPFEKNGPSVHLEKIDNLPSPGIRIKTQSGYVYLWVEKGMLYKLTLDPCESVLVASDYLDRFFKL